ncbi:hypothetical protein Tco_0454227 [Tanacetum coccineum]
MLVDALQQHEVEGQVNMMVEKVRGLEIKREMVEVVKEVAEVANKMAEVAKEVAEVAKEVVEVVKKVIRVVKVQTRGRDAAVGMTWEDFKTLTRDEFCPNNEMQKLETEFWCHVMVEAGHAAYIDRAPTMIYSVVQKAGMLTDEAIRNEALKKITEKRRNSGEPSRDGKTRDDNKRPKT